MKKRMTLAIAAVLLICLTIAACASQDSTDSAAPPEQPDLASASGQETETAAPPEQQTEASSAAGPVSGNQIEDGTYKIEVSSSSEMFRVADALLTVKDGEMTAVLTLSGVGYEKLFMGTGEEALAETDDKCIYFVENTEGEYTYEVPVAVLDRDTDVAAWSIKKQEWYDRVLVFESSQLPAEAMKTD